MIEKINKKVLVAIGIVIFILITIAVFWFSRITEDESVIVDSETTFEPTETPLIDLSKYEEVMAEYVTWSDVREEFITLEAELSDLEDGGYTVSDSEADELIQTVAEEYVTLYNGITKSTVEDSKILYSAGRKLMMSDDEGLQALGKEAKNYVLAYYDFLSQDAHIALCEFYTELLNYMDQIDIELEEPNAYETYVFLYLTEDEETEAEETTEDESTEATTDSTESTEKDDNNSEVVSDEVAEGTQEVQEETQEEVQATE